MFIKVKFQHFINITMFKIVEFRMNFSISTKIIKMDGNSWVTLPIDIDDSKKNYKLKFWIFFY